MEVEFKELQDLLEYFSKNTYKARDTHPKVQRIMQRCLQLFELDYKYSVINNTAGELSTNYPSMMVYLESEKSPRLSSTSTSLSDAMRNDVSSSSSSSTATPSYLPSPDEQEMPFSSSVPPSYKSVLMSQPKDIQESNVLEPSKLKDLCSRARLARCRARFPIPVILYDQKHICRSATLSGGPEIYGRSSMDYFFSGGNDNKWYNEPDPIDDVPVNADTQSEWQLFDRVRSQDIRLLKSFEVQTIVDLMVENKKVKFGMNVTSSEKVDKENRYSDFNLISLPYPGCEFFKQYRDNGYNGRNLVFEWNQGHVDANILVPQDMTTSNLKIDWYLYRNWDLVKLTQNYLKLLLAHIKDGHNGMLIHCISGWDRTPLFISLLRLSLWADGAIHKSLDCKQILYLTIAYDWLLFGHNLEDRLSKGEEIFYFCFYFLQFIIDPEFSVDYDKFQPEKPVHSQLARVRNDSDIQLDGVLLDGEGSHTSPEGSNWSLNSCSSFQSNPSVENPPAYFPVDEDYNSSTFHSQPYFNRQSSPSHMPAIVCSPLVQFSNNCATPTNSGILEASNVLTSSATTNGNNDCLVIATDTTEVLVQSTPLSNPDMLTSALGIAGETSLSTPLKNGNGVLVSDVISHPLSPSFYNSSDHSPDSCSFHFPTNNGASHSGNNSLNRTSPVAVPKTSSPFQNSSSGAHRPESNSSASIGSWQLINGAGSLREAISSSHRSSNSSHSHPSKTHSGSVVSDCVEASESSCTLIDQLAPSSSSMEKSEQLVPHSVVPSELNGSCVLQEDWKLFEKELGGDEDVIELGKESLEELTSAQGGSSYNNESIATPKNVTPTKDANVFRRRERLQFVRAQFDSLYANTIRFRSPVSEYSSGASSSGSGLGSLIGNFATKVGIRAGNRL